MPEGDSVWKAARRMADGLVGRTVTASDFRVPQHATADLSGRQVLAFDSYGKHMLTRFSGGLTLHTHFEMDGSWQLVGPGRRLPSTFDDEVRLVLSTDGPTAYALRMPVLELIATDDEPRVMGHLGPDVLGAGLGRGRGRPRGCRPTPTGRSSRRCSTRRTSPASATCGRSRPATCGASPRGRRCATSTWPAPCGWPAG